MIRKGICGDGSDPEGGGTPQGERASRAGRVGRADETDSDGGVSMNQTEKIITAAIEALSAMTPEEQEQVAQESLDAVLAGLAATDPGEMEASKGYHLLGGAETFISRRAELQERYRRMPEQLWFKRAHEGRSCGPEAEIEDAQEYEADVQAVKEALEEQGDRPFTPLDEVLADIAAIEQGE